MKYRFLKVGEIVEENDQLFHAIGGWKKIKPFLPGVRLWECNVGGVRRPIKSTSRTSTNSRFSKCPHCGKAIKAGTSKSGRRWAKG